MAITGLSLPYLSQVHWVARASLLVAVTSGCLSVYYSCVLQRTIGRLCHPNLVRDWLSLPRFKERTATRQEASLPATIILSAPFTMMEFSITTFLIGLAIYQGFVWTKGLDSQAGKQNSRSVFIFFTTGTGLCFVYFDAFALKEFENLLLLRNRHKHHEKTELTPLPGGRRPMRSDGTLENSTTGHENSSPRPRHSADVATDGLAAALQAAAQAHLTCAEADRQVALQYAQAARSPEGV